MQRQDSAGYLANHMARLFKAMLNARLAPLGLSSAPFGLLLELWRNDGLSQSELVARFDIEQATIAATLTRMERDGLVKRRPDPVDRRRQIVTVTARANALKADAIRAAEAANRDALAALAPGEGAMFLALMRRVIEAQRQALADITAS